MSRSIMKTTNIGIKKVTLNKKKATHKSPISPLNLPQYAFSLLEREKHRVEVVSKKKETYNTLLRLPGDRDHDGFRHVYQQNTVTDEWSVSETSEFRVGSG